EAGLRATVVAACGTGKTFIAAAAAPARAGGAGVGRGRVRQGPEDGQGPEYGRARSTAGAT
ncbi:hypothetical protein, partial [Streptomyces sp. NPDC054865]